MRRVVYLAWTQRPARQLEIAAALGATPLIFTRPRLTSRTLVPLRYVLHSLWSLVSLARRRPDTVIVTNPPVPAAAVAALYCLVARRRLILDSHPAGFGAQGDRISARLQFLHRWAIRRAHAVLVTTDAYAPLVESLGSQIVVVHEPADPEPSARLSASPSPSGRHRGTSLNVLFVCIFAPDEPVRVVLEAARLVPDATVRITGDPRRAPADLLTDLPTNVELTGYLDQASYRRALHEADVVLALTTEPSSVMRAAYEAVNAARPLIVTDWPDLQAAFPYAVATANTADSIAAALQKVSTRLACLEADAGAARLVQADRWRAQLERLREVVGVEGVERIEEVPV